MGAIGAAVAGGVASAAIGTAGSALMKGSVSGANSQAQGALGQQLNQLAPYQQAGLPAVQAQQNLLGLNGQDAANAAMANFQSSPGYAYQVQQGLRAVDAGAASNGMLRSGATIKAEETLGQNLANQNFQQYYQNLSGLSTLGENAGAQTGVTAGQQAQADIGAGNAQSSIYGNLATGLGANVNNLLSNKNLQSWFSASNPPAYNPAGGLNYTPGTSPGYGNQTFQSGGVF
jgi:hypothetical protein